MKLELQVQKLQALLRAFQYGDELDALAAQLLERLARLRQRRADQDNRVELKALALLAEYLDAHGRSKDAAALLRHTATELLDSALGDSADPKLQRQRVWCCLAYALTHLRAGRTDDAGVVLQQLGRYITQHLIQPGFPCHGTVALLRYYEGLWLRNSGRLDDAARAFDEALDQADLRYRDKRSKYEKLDPDRLRRELVYCRVMTARILGFGHGGIALARGRYLEARGWLIGASQVLAQFGQQHWRRGLEVYARSASVLIAEQPGRLATEQAALDELATWFEPTNTRNAFVARAFSLVAEARPRLVTNDLKGLRPRLLACLRAAGTDAGPLTANAALALIECLLRCGWHDQAARELDRLERWIRKDAEVIAEERILRASIATEAQQYELARQILEPLLERRIANRGHWARGWAQLALVEFHSGRPLWAERALATAEDAVQSAQDGYSATLVHAVGLRIRTRAVVPLAMPYQQDGDSPLHCDMDHNLELARLNVVATAYARHPGATIEELARAVGRGPSWLYDFLGRHRQLPWVDALFQRKSSSSLPKALPATHNQLNDRSTNPQPGRREL